jgi:hypothetical protein
VDASAPHEDLTVHRDDKVLAHSPRWRQGLRRPDGGGLEQRMTRWQRGLQGPNRAEGRMSRWRRRLQGLNGAEG